MNCTVCTTKACKVKGKDCTGAREEHLQEYKKTEIKELYLNADTLVAGGRAGSLNRLQEIILFCRESSFKKIGIAYCFSMENLAHELMGILTAEGFTTSACRCTIGGIKEDEIMCNGSGSVNCNPITQAKTLNAEKVDFVIEMGLCLGHDVIFHQYIEAPFTVFITKDRVFNHNPARALLSYNNTGNR